MKRKQEQYATNPAEYKSRHHADRIKHLAKRMLGSARNRAQQRGVPFTIKVEDIVLSDVCPVLNIPMQVNSGISKYNSPSLDRIIPELGYVPGNIIVISLKANQIKNCSSIEELQMVYEFFNKKIRGAS